MLKLLDDFNQTSNFGILNQEGMVVGAGSKASKETATKSSSLANRSKKRQGNNEVDDIFLKHDGLFVDYNKFGDLTKDMLKNSHVLRNKSIKSPTRINQNSTGSRNQAPHVISS